MIEFTTWFLTELPDFLLAEPVVYFVGILVCFGVVRLLSMLFHIRRVR